MEMDQVLSKVCTTQYDGIPWGPKKEKEKTAPDRMRGQRSMSTREDHICNVQVPPHKSYI